MSPGLSPRGQVNKAQLNKENEDEALKQATQREQASPRTNTTNQHNRGTITSGKRVLAVLPRDRPPTRNEREKREEKQRKRERERERRQRGKDDRGDEDEHDDDDDDERESQGKKGKKGGEKRHYSYDGDGRKHR